MKTDGCPACACKLATDPGNGTKTRSVVKCTRCGALYTVHAIYLGESFEIVRPFFDPDPNPTEQCYFDFVTLGAAGVGRRHGWFNPKTRLLTQVG